jgi:hypothetical protein
MQALMHTQKRFLAQIACIFRVTHHALDDVPAQALIFAHESFERARPIGQHGVDQFAVGAAVDVLHAARDTRRCHPVASLFATVRTRPVSKALTTIRPDEPP